MKEILISDLRAGMKFDQPVYIEGENILVPAEIPVKQKDIDRLIRWEIDVVFSDGSVIQDQAQPDPEGAGTSLSWRPFQDDKYLKVYRHCLEKVDVIFQDIVEGTLIGHESIDDVVNDLLELLRQGKNETIQLIFSRDWPQRKLTVSALNSTIVASVMGGAIKLTSHRLLQLATGALLHDVGMLKVPKEILNKQSTLSPEELNRIRTHPILGYRIVSKELKYPEEIAFIALQHQERWDGKGYPRGLKGEDISLSGRILSVADAYEAMISERAYRTSVIGYSAMKNILSDNGKHFDPRVLKAFLESMGVFPIGSIVQLNNSSIGRVAESHADAPLRPKLELVLDEFGSKLDEHEIVDLRQKKSLFIVKALDPKTIGAG